MWVAWHLPCVMSLRGVCGSSSLAFGVQEGMKVSMLVTLLVRRTC